ncbi:hypothetical protein GGR54DRAFT_626081 [Hypoxylon sp. NC1633]|nr:hypothetical protein GGR54DRAFT_626081 [Hypoxylon sp. NC1633]
MSSTEPGPLVRLWGLPTEMLPPQTASADELPALLRPILEEALPFIDSAAPRSGAPPDRTLWKHKGTHSQADSAARVEVLERVVPAADLEKVAESRSGNGKDKVRPETWCCRRSVHEDKAARGTAAWPEFERCFRDEHAETERKFTPACLAARQALEWDCGGFEATAGADDGGLTYARFTLVVEEMRHRIGRPVLRDRTFPVLQMTCAATTQQEFLVVSIPVPDFGARSPASTLASEKGAQVAFYVSVERFRRLDDGNIEWLMATASDAAGALPAWVQNMAAPGVIWKDVPLFLGWIGREREKRGGDGTNGGQKENGKDGGLPQESTGPHVGDVPAVSGATGGAGAVASESP